MIWETIARILVTIPSIIYAVILILSALGFVLLLALTMWRSIKDRHEGHLVADVLGILFVIILVGLGLIFGS
jgi:hypothetical protein